MKKRLILFACIASFALSTCENQQVIHILSAPSELDFLSVIAYAGEYAMPGGSSLEPSLRADVFDYTAYVDKDATHFVIDAEVDGEGTVTVHSDQVTGDTFTRFDLLGDEAVVTVKATRQYMETTEYRVTVIRGEPVPTAKDVKISAEPGIAAFFIGSGVIPTIKVTAVPPGTGVVLNYQWYVNDENNTRTGNPITNAEGDSYQMQAIETMTERTIYYYVEITSVVDGKTGITQSAPCAVTFINKSRLNEKSLAMVDVPAGTVTESQWYPWYAFNNFPDWSTPGFKMGRNVVTWELWKTVFDYAEAGNYTIERTGNQGAAVFLNWGNNSTIFRPRPIGNRMHPVTNISWRDAVIWCNAYSDMDGLEPVYRDLEGNVLRDSRAAVDLLCDPDRIADYNGYRLPTYEEWSYAGRGADPLGDHWGDRYPGTNSSDVENVLSKYLWTYSPGANSQGFYQTGEVESLLPNSIGLYDMLGMVYQWAWWPQEEQYGYDDMVFAFGSDFDFETWSLPSLGNFSNVFPMNFYNGLSFVGFRVARNRN